MQFTESKARLAERIQSSVKDTSSLIRQVIKSSKSTELLVHSIKNLAATDASTETIDLSLKRSHALSNQMKLQLMQMRILEIDCTARRLQNCLTRASASISNDGEIEQPQDSPPEASTTGLG